MHLSHLGLRHLKLAAILLLAGPAAIAADFQKLAGQWHQDHQDAFRQAGKLSLSGEVARANQSMIELADKDGGGVAAFIVGNLLYRSDPAASYRLHAKALQAYPDAAETQLEMAMERHRRGEYAAAIPLYRRVVLRNMGPQFFALLADCLIRTGQLKDAVAAWEQARHGNNHTAIDFAIYEIYGERMPAQRRGELLEKIKAGDHAKLVELIILDVRFDQDWWNSSVFDEGLDLDLPLAASLLGEKSPAYQHLAAYARLARQEEKKADEIRTVLTEAKLVLGPGAALPEDSRLARAVCELAIGSEATSAQAVWEAHAATLRERVARHDAEALHLLCWLAVETKNGELDALDRAGWVEWKDSEFAASYIVGRIDQKKITAPDDPELLAALQVAPENSVLNRARLHLAGETGMTREMIVATIKAEYRKLSVGLIIPDSYRLKALFAGLKEKL